MPYLGFIRNGRLSCLKIGSIDAARNHARADGDSQDYVRQVRLLDEVLGSYWRVIGGQWQEFEIEHEDTTVEEMIAELGLDLDSRSPESRAEVYSAPVAVAEPIAAVETVMPRETVVDLRTYTRGRARREGRRKR